ncbi:DUF4347 domain-containing protein [uncultured Maribacter sp.]|uniref:DUF4347 domain-containing protein n=1 Tax=uncultured Maribacter sp. TaxID=431308 RepID=UPI00261DC50D|nr:DUF4347 domain-containing protein [uncultured Maribacter sp.]
MQTKYSTSKRTFIYVFFFLCLKFYAQSGSKNLVVIDSDFSEKTQIISTLSTNQVLVELNNTTNAWKQIREFLQENSEIKTIHLFANASYNSLQMGGVAYDLNSVNAEFELSMLEGLYQGEHIQLLVYNCNLGSNTDGLALIKAIGEKAYFNVGACTSCTSIFDTAFNFDYWSLSASITNSILTK